jgi:outer membrane protein assembly factor BamB
MSLTHFRKIFVVLILAVCFSALNAGQADEWPIIHNVNHIGFSPTTVLKPPLKMKWAAKVQGSFKAGPVAAEGKVVLQSRDGYMFCFDAESGALQWRYFVQRLQAHNAGYTETGPCIANGRAYANFFSLGHFGVSGMRCFDLKTGALLWKRDAGWTGHRQHFSPQVTANRLFFCSNRALTAGLAENLDKYPMNAQVQCWDAVTGDTLWTYTMANRACENTTLLVVGDTIFASVAWSTAIDSGKTVALDTNGNVIWESTVHHVSNYTGNMQYFDGKLLLHTAQSGGIRIVNTSDWSVVLQAGGGDCYSKISPIMNGKYYNRSYASFAAPRYINTGTSAPYASFWQRGAGSGCGAPAAANGYVYNVMGGGSGTVYESNVNYPRGVSFDAGFKIVAIDEAGDIAWWHQDRSHHCASVAVAYDKLYVGAGTEGMVYCFENDK